MAAANRLMLRLDDLLYINLPDWNVEAIDHIKIAQRGRDVIAFAFEEHHTFEGMHWLVMHEPFPGREVFAAGLDYHIFSHFSAFELGALVDLHPTNFADYGLDNPSLEFVYHSFLGDAHLLFGDVFFREVGGREVAYIYVQLAGRPHVFEALYEPVSFLFDINVLRFIERFIALVNIRDTAGLEVSSPGGDFEISINHIEDTEDIAPTINDNPVDDALFRTVYRLIIGLTIDSELEPFSPTDAPLYVVRYFMTDADDIEIRLFHYNDNFLAVSLNGEDVWFATNRRNFNMFIERLAELG